MATRGAGRATAAASAITRARRCWADSQATRLPNGKDAFPSIQRLVRYTDPMRGACDRWVMSRPRAVAPHLDLSLNTYAGPSRPHRAVLTCLTMSGSFRRVLLTITITVTRARVRASKSARIQVGLTSRAPHAGALRACRAGLAGRKAAREIPAACPCPRPARHGRGCGTRANFPGADLVNVSADGRFRAGPARRGTARAGPGGRGQGALPLRHLQDLRRLCSNHPAAAATHRHYHPAR